MDNLMDEINALKGYEFDFENLAFEGGGAKMGAYIGVVKALEAIGVLQTCHRFAGTSGGSLVAALLAVNQNADQVREFSFALRVNDLVSDSTLGLLAALPNILRKFGWNPASNYINNIRNYMEKVTGNPDITFRQVYERYGNELCIPATNVSSMSLEYFHPKTTPDLPIAVAVRASGALPGYVQPVCIKTEEGLKQYYIDGGLVCNFPLHVFDGWYLSMKPENCFFRKMGSADEFTEFNHRTLGFILYTPWEGEYMQGELQSRYKEDKPIARPGTPLAKKRGKKCDAYLASNINKQHMVDAAKRFLVLMREMDIDQNNEVSLDEFKMAFEKLDMNPNDVKLLFGEDFDFKRAFYEIDRDHNGQITFDEFIMHLENKGINFRAILEGGNMMEINSFSKFFGIAVNTVLTMSRKIYAKDDDIHRSAGVYTDYVDTADFNLLIADKKFLTNQGITGTVAYFQDLVHKYQSGSLPDSMAGCVQPKRLYDNSIEQQTQINQPRTSMRYVNSHSGEWKRKYSVIAMDASFTGIEYETMDKAPRDTWMVVTAVGLGLLVFIFMALLSWYLIRNSMATEE